MVLVGVAVAVGVAFYTGYFSYSTTYSYTDGLGESCNVLALSLNGYLTTYSSAEEAEATEVETASEDIVYSIEQADKDEEIRGVLLLVDSDGGSGVAGEEIANALKRLSKPNVAVIRGSGLSAAYWAATGADRVFASSLSDVGSIGVTSSYLDESQVKQKEGYRFIELASGKYKDVWNPEKPITEEDKAIIMEGILKMHDIFVKQVATNRNLDLEEVKKLANGLSYIGEDALKLGLIDEIGDMSTATKYLESQIGEEAEICWQ